jgi:glutathione peroxidase
MTNFFDFQMESIDGETVAFDKFRDQMTLVVNVASQWGLTPQYAGLRTLHEDIDGLNVLGIPCNQFGGQEPGTNAEILEFATSKYDVNFPMFAKVDVNGENEAPLYTFLKATKSDEDGNADLAWNFTKFLVDRNGEVIERFAPQVTPEEIGGKLAELM